MTTGAGETAIEAREFFEAKWSTVVRPGSFAGLYQRNLNQTLGPWLEKMEKAWQELFVGRSGGAQIDLGPQPQVVNRADLAEISLLYGFYRNLRLLLESAQQSEGIADLQRRWRKACNLKPYQQLLDGQTARHRKEVATRALVDLYGWLSSLLGTDLSTNALEKLGDFEVSIRQHLLPVEKGWQDGTAEKAAFGLVMRAIINRWSHTAGTGLSLALDMNEVPCHHRYWVGVWVCVDARPPIHDDVRSLRIYLDAPGELEVAVNKSSKSGNLEFDLTSWRVGSERRRFWIRGVCAPESFPPRLSVHGEVCGDDDTVLYEQALPLTIVAPQWNLAATEQAIHEVQEGSDNEPLIHTRDRLERMFPGVVFDRLAVELLEALLHEVQGDPVLRIYLCLKRLLEWKKFPFIDEQDLERVFEECEGPAAACEDQWTRNLEPEQRGILKCFYGATEEHHRSTDIGPEIPVTLGDLVAKYPDEILPDRDRVRAVLDSLEGSWIRTEVPGVVYRFSSRLRRLKAGLL